MQRLSGFQLMMTFASLEESFEKEANSLLITPNYRFNFSLKMVLWRIH